MLPAIQSTILLNTLVVHIIFFIIFAVDQLFLPSKAHYACFVFQKEVFDKYSLVARIHQKAFSYLIYVNFSKTLIAFVPH